jgi:hypothetical protein
MSNTVLYRQGIELQNRLKTLYFTCEDETMLDKIYELWKRSTRRADRRWKNIWK